MCDRNKEETADSTEGRGKARPPTKPDVDPFLPKIPTTKDTTADSSCRWADIRWYHCLKNVAQKSPCTWHLASHTSRSVRKADLSQPAAPMFVICCLPSRVDRCSHSFCTLHDTEKFTPPASACLPHTRVCA